MALTVEEAVAMVDDVLQRKGEGGVRSDIAQTEEKRENGAGQRCSPVKASGRQRGS
jgi:hypothetical protein